MMAVTGVLFYKSNRLFYIANLDLLMDFDILKSESHQLDSDVTSHPVEDGSTISDHIQNRLITGSLQGVVSNFSLKMPGIFENRAQSAYETMLKIRDARELCTITTVLQVYQNVAITGVQIGRSSEDGESLTMNVTFRQVKTVKLLVNRLELSINAIKVPNMNAAQDKQSAPKKDMGRVVQFDRGRTVQ